MCMCVCVCVVCVCVCVCVCACVHVCMCVCVCVCVCVCDLEGGGNLESSLFLPSFLTECPGGTWGPNCTKNCTCGEGGNGCHHISGSCECNDCYTGAMCEICEPCIHIHTVCKCYIILASSLLHSAALGADCVQYFLEIEDKVHNIHCIYALQLDIHVTYTNVDNA